MKKRYPVLGLNLTRRNVHLGAILVYKSVLRFLLFCSMLTTFGVNSSETDRHSNCDIVRLCMLLLCLLLSVILFANQNFLDDFLELVYLVLF